MKPIFLITTLLIARLLCINASAGHKYKIIIDNSTDHTVKFYVDGDLACSLKPIKEQEIDDMCVVYYPAGTHNVRAEFSNNKSFSCRVTLYESQQLAGGARADYYPTERLLCHDGCKSNCDDAIF